MEYRSVKGYEKNYLISRMGDVKSIKRRGTTGGYIKPEISNSGYLRVKLFKNGEGKNHLLHRLVAQAFVHNPDPRKFKIVAHKDNDPLNPAASNLEWTDYSTNTQQAYDDDII